MRETRLYGSVRGAVSNDRPYRELSHRSGVLARDLAITALAQID
jgi:hypothetical protein